PTVGSNGNRTCTGRTRSSCRPATSRVPRSSRQGYWSGWSSPSHRPIWIHRPDVPRPRGNSITDGDLVTLRGPGRLRVEPGGDGSSPRAVSVQDVQGVAVVEHEPGSVRRPGGRPYVDAEKRFARSVCSHPIPVGVCFVVRGALERDPGTV